MRLADNLLPFELLTCFVHPYALNPSLEVKKVDFKNGKKLGKKKKNDGNKGGNHTFQAS